MNVITHKMTPRPWDNCRRLLLAGGLAWLLAGCAAFTKREVTVDAINDPAQPQGLSYRLVSKVNPAVSTKGERLNSKALAYVTAALATKGMFEAPLRAKPDMVIEMDYGVGRAQPHVELGAVHEKYLQLLARRYREDANPRRPGEEMWSVRVSVEERSPNLEPSLPVLATVAGDYAGLNTITQKTLRVSEHDAAVVLVKSTAQIPGSRN